VKIINNKDITKSASTKRQMQKQILMKYEYVIKIDGKEVWRGLNPKEKYWNIKDKNPNKEVGIAWESQEDVLIC